MSYAEEFRTVEVILQSDAETRGVDAFALSLIKAERQIRKIFTHLIYQCPGFGPDDIPRLRETLAAKRGVYFDGFVKGFDALYCRSLRDVVGNIYDTLRARLDEAIEHRNKIFHGQVTQKGLTREELLAYVRDIREWCERLATSGLQEFQYDGFARNSLQKSQVLDLWRRFRVQLNDVAEYGHFISQHMER